MDLSLRRVGIVVSAVAALTLPAAPAVAAGDEPTVASGPCSAGSTWQLSVEPTSRLLAVTYTVDSDVAGEVWKFRVNSDRGALRIAGSLPTGEDGSFSVEMLPPNLPGSNMVVGRAVNAQTGEVCTGGVIVG